MLQTYKSYTRRTLAMLLAVLVAVGALFSGSFPVHAADGTIIDRLCSYDDYVAWKLAKEA